MGCGRSPRYAGFDLSGLIDPQSRYLQNRLHFTCSTQEYSTIFRDLNVEKGDGF